MSKDLCAWNYLYDKIDFYSLYGPNPNFVSRVIKVIEMVERGFYNEINFSLDFFIRITNCIRKFAEILILVLTPTPNDDVAAPIIMVTYFNTS